MPVDMSMVVAKKSKAVFEKLTKFLNFFSFLIEHFFVGNFRCILIIDIFFYFFAVFLFAFCLVVSVFLFVCLIVCLPVGPVHLAVNGCVAVYYAPTGNGYLALLMKLMMRKTCAKFNKCKAVHRKFFYATRSKFGSNLQ